ncbi:MAG TPA: hypothetical protein DEF78_09305 [Sphingobacterium sp.]|nr:hypothetical protein [Sphingobacterium sp.]
MVDRLGTIKVFFRFSAKLAGYISRPSFNSIPCAKYWIAFFSVNRISSLPSIFKTAPAPPGRTSFLCPYILSGIK